MKSILFILLTSLLASANILEIKSKEYDIEKVYQGKSVLWGFDFINENKIIISHKKKSLVYYDLKTKEKINLPTPKFKKGGQGGLLDVIYYKNKVYISYSKEVSEDETVTALASGDWKNKSIENLKDIYVTNAGGDAKRHFGSRLLIKDDSIFMTVGDRTDRDLSQSLEYDNGSILRLTLQGEPHPQNKLSQKRKAIFSYGHRNPQGITLVNNNIISAEFGPRGGDELNFIEEGKNYGWPVITYGKEYWGPSIGEEKKKGMEQPLHYWVPSISPSGIAYYQGDKLKEFKNKLFVANLSSSHLRMLDLNNDFKVQKETILFKDLEERFRMVRQSPDGYLYFSTDSGKLYRIKSKK